MNTTTADVIVIGGGVAGLSTAMQLAARGQRVIVIERQRFGNGSTGRAAGLLGQLRGTAESTRMLMRGVEIVQELEERAGVKIYVRTGSLRIAETPARAQEILDLVAMGKSIGFDIDRMPLDEVARRLPYMRTDDLLEACFCPTDGHLLPPELVSAYMTLGQQQGVQYHENCRVEQVLLSAGKAAGVRTSHGEFSAPVLVNAAGPWSYLIAELAETTLPTAAVMHCNLKTEPFAAIPIDPLSPAIRDRHLRMYSRPEKGGLIVGTYPATTTPVDMHSLSPDFDMSTLKAELQEPHVQQLLEVAGRRFPWLDERVPLTINQGIMTFTPDGRPFCGKLPDIEGLYHCSGFCGHGIVQSPAIGVIMAELICDGSTSFDLEAIEADRYFDQPGFRSREEIETRCYAMHSAYYGRLEGEQAS